MRRADVYAMLEPSHGADLAVEIMQEMARTPENDSETFWRTQTKAQIDSFARKHREDWYA